MFLECVAPFGVHVVGDRVEVPDDAVFDVSHYRQVEESDDFDSDVRRSVDDDESEDE
jgi:hypothetical protein